MALAQSVLTDINGLVAAIFYVVAGLGWVLPAMLLIRWMRAAEIKPRDPSPLIPAQAGIQGCARRL